MSIYQVPKYSWQNELAKTQKETLLRLEAPLPSSVIKPEKMKFPKKTSSYTKTADDIQASKDAITAINADLVPNKSKGLSVTGAANIVSGISTLAGVATNIIGARRANEMKPTLPGYRAPIEPTLIDSNTEATKSSATEMIDRSIAGVKDVNRRYGRTTGGEVLAKELAATNELSGKLSEQRTAIDATNAQMENRFKQYNDQTERQRASEIAQITNNFDMQKANIVSGAMTGIQNDIRSGAQSIMTNIATGKQMQLVPIMNSIEQVKGKLLLYPNSIELKKQLEELESQKNNLYTKIWGA